MKGSSFIKEGTWDLPSPPSALLVNIFKLISEAPIPSIEFTDEIILIGSDNGDFMLSSLAASNSHPVVDWKNQIWFKGRISKHSVLYGWLLMILLKQGLF